VASPRDIRRRIRSISNTAQITRAMQMVAASKMRKAQQAAIEVRPFVQLLYRIQRKATTRRLDFRHPLLEERPVRSSSPTFRTATRLGSLNPVRSLRWPAISS